MKLLTEHTILEWLESVKDPEVPVLSILDLGIVRKVELINDPINPFWEITITPTYSGCPAMDVISTQIRMILFANGISNFRIKQVLSPAWTTDWMSDAGREKLKAYGIAPPQYSASGKDNSKVVCPNCGSADTTVISEFGSTACKALYRCENCLEPFDYFKCH
ncbi:1,2-phenylacetyl-CoA epoxidase subunit PaaD [Pollutibacter soli]|uniref:1,2-phenylacetyl-CoA epoxidase subunit PaaD n=1 Tax=Pollutibacter soli TaxID=3034157 RepID=UPI003013A3CB